MITFSCQYTLITRLLTPQIHILENTMAVVNIMHLYFTISGRQSARKKEEKT